MAVEKGTKCAVIDCDYYYPKNDKLIHHILSINDEYMNIYYNLIKIINSKNIIIKYNMCEKINNQYYIHAVFDIY